MERVLSAIQHHAGSAEILVIDDGSTDNSREILSGDSQIHLIRHPRNLGYGQSLINAFGYAAALGFESLVTIDCDEQHEPQRIPEFFRRLTEGWDIVSGSRYLGASAVQGTVPGDRQKINQEITQQINALTGYGLTDSFCGLKAYRVAALQQLRLTETGYGFPLQLWLQAYRLGLRITELPVARIYIDGMARSFGPQLDNPEERLRYYQQVIAKEAAQWK